MKKKLISAVLSLSLAATMCGGFATTASAAAKTPQYQAKERMMEELNRGLIAVKTSGGVYLSWRLFGTESLAKQEFDIYRNGTYIHTVDGGQATNWTDPSGTVNDSYKVITTGENLSKVEAVKPTTNTEGDYSYMDVPVEMPSNSLYRRIELTKDGKYAGTGGGINDAAVGDLDCDGDYEIVLKWDPSNSKDAASGGTTGRVYLDGYEISEDNTNSDGKGHLYKWRIDLGPHVRAGAHETPFLVYDFDGDGGAEIVSLTGPGAVDGTGKYVTEVGDTEEIRNADNELLSLSKGKNIGPEYYTIFDGETGAALWTTEAIPIGRTDGKDWGKNTLNESQRYLATVAYLDGVHPSFVMCRGYYYRAAMRAYSWDGSELTRIGEYDAKTGGIDSLYGQGNHNLSVGDIDNDGKDEIVYGSACLDDDLRTVMGNTQLGHGDAMHMSDFNNDGIQEVFSVKEDPEGWYNKYAEDLRVASTGKHFWEEGKICWTTKLNPANRKTWDNGRGIMDNVDDEYAKANPNALAICWSSGFANAHDLNGNDIGPKAGAAARGGNTNFLIYWDDDLGRELLDTTIICKYHAPGGNIDRLATFNDVSANNSTKYTPSLVADLWGDWREEVIFAANDTQAAIDAGKQPAMRIFTSNIPTQYRIPTLMHDSQYRMSVAWQNVGYNQPTHTSYYVGSAALATDASGNTLNYLAPAVAYTNVTYEPPESIAVTGMTLQEDKVTVEKGKTVTVNAVITPSDATKKGITWTSSDTSVATVSNGIIKGVGEGKATITATAKDTTNGTFTDTCEVTVYSSPVTGITLSDKVIELGVDYTAKLKATVYPTDATDKSVTWTSADPAVASVSSDGTVTGLSYGKTTVTATTNDGGLTASCIVKVKPIGIMDVTGDDVFVTSNTDAETVFEATAKSASLKQTNATVGAEFHKDFEVYNENKVKISFKFNTGGQRVDGGTSGGVNWIGHEYTYGLQFLDADGKNIVTLSQAHTTSAQQTQSKIGDENATQASSAWNCTSNKNNSPFGRSMTKWDVEFEFDYDNDVCRAKIIGGDGEGDVCEKTFNLNGAKFKTLKYYTTKDTDTATITVTPSISNLSYAYSTKATGNTELLYEKGSENTEWTESDLADWTQTGTDIAALALDSENGRVWYNATQPTGGYSATKTFSNIADDALVTYDVDWYFGSAVNRDGNFEYVQFGDKLRIGWTNGYVTWVSTDGGTTWNDNDSDGTTDSIFTGANATYTKNIKVIFDTKTNTIKSFKFDGNEISAYTDYALEGAAFDSVSFGFQRGGAAPAWAVPNGIDRIRVSQFVYGEEEPDFSAVKIANVNGNTVNVSYNLVDYNENVILIGALYDNSGKLVEMKSSDNLITDDSMQNIRQGTYSFSFTNNAADYKLKVFMWDSLNGMIPISDAAK